MKKLIILIIGCSILASIIITIAFCMGFKYGQYKQQDKIDLPEESEAITTDQKHPDTLLGYTLNNRLYLRFKH